MLLRESIPLSSVNFGELKHSPDWNALPSEMRRARFSREV